MDELRQCGRMWAAGKRPIRVQPRALRPVIGGPIFALPDHRFGTSHSKWPPPLPIRTARYKGFPGIKDYDMANGRHTT